MPGIASMPQPRAQRPRPPLDHYVRAGEARGLQWSPLRRAILEILGERGIPWGAYALAARLSRDGPRAHANSVYRSLARLEAARLVIPVVTWNRHLISPDPDIDSWCVLLCSSCKTFQALPMEEEGSRLRSIVRSTGFRPARIAIECVGTCRSCSQTDYPQDADRLSETQEGGIRSRGAAAQPQYS